MDRILSGSVAQAKQALQAGTLSYVDLVKACLNRMKQIESLNAYVTAFEETSVSAAALNDVKGKQQSLLCGIPFAVKDNFCMQGVRTTCASKMLYDYHPPYTATVVNRLLRAGMIAVGKTNMEEFAMGAGGVMSFNGAIKNVWKSGIPQHLVSCNDESISNVKDPSECETDWYVAGGSSGGSAVAVASGSCFAALGSDTGGSVRAPASLNGIIGMKPSYGLLSRHGLISLVNSLDTVGVMARKAEDVAIVLLAMIGRDKLDSTSVDAPQELVDDLKGLHDCSNWETKKTNLRIGLPKEYFSKEMHPEVVDAWDSVAGILSDTGMSVEVVSQPHADLACPCYAVLNTAEVASNFARYDGLEYGLRIPGETVSTNHLYASNRAAGFGNIVKGRILTGNYFLLKENYEEYFEKALKIRRLISEDFKTAFSEKKFDFLLTPVHNSPALKYSQFMQLQENYEEFTLHDHCTMPANMAGVPAVVFPVRLSAGGMPISLQLIGPMFSEGKLLGLVKWIEKRLNFPRLELMSS
ncbi:unnamed protein product [Notodromas monacha]|uniref:Glutamyl-tRNA(Gln) amidotransferase subunit A, mitochondrial n=1 Tax=Notodromas monacha TaxID=399045 RepID=A0A7R9GG75_9CRUS|nr:unnamed protein product [Notodromas monacha]CAG0921542.1 unnamed protein product [Notodromas monacha]